MRPDRFIFVIPLVVIGTAVAALWGAAAWLIELVGR